MPITAAQLEPGDILFKHASAGAVSGAIKKGQKSHLLKTIKSAGVGASGDACDITHVAVAAGQNDVLEFDEGGSGTLNIIFKKGYGFVRGNMNLDSRKGNRYEVFKCLNPSLKNNVADKIDLMWDISHQDTSNLTASYGLKKVISTAVGHNHGKSFSSTKDFEAQLDSWLQSGVLRANRGRTLRTFTSRPNMQFFCSEFVTFVYLWAASEAKAGKIFGSDYLFGTDKSRIAPVELYSRIETMGKSFFTFKGTMYT